MPKFIGRTIPGSRDCGIENATVENFAFPAVRLTYAQAAKLDPRDVWFSLDTTDGGSRGAYAKRWNRWFACAFDIITRNSQATPRMVELARARLREPQRVSVTASHIVEGA